MMRKRVPKLTRYLADVHARVLANGGELLLARSPIGASGTNGGKRNG